MKAWIEGFAQLEIYFLKVGRHQVEKRYTHKVLVRGQTGGVVIYSVCFGITGLGISESVLGGCIVSSNAAAQRHRRACRWWLIAKQPLLLRQR